VRFPVNFSSFADQSGAGTYALRFLFVTAECCPFTGAGFCPAGRFFNPKMPFFEKLEKRKHCK